MDRWYHPENGLNSRTSQLGNPEIRNRSHGDLLQNRRTTKHLLGSRIASCIHCWSRTLHNRYYIFSVGGKLFFSSALLASTWNAPSLHLAWRCPMAWKELVVPAWTLTFSCTAHFLLQWACKRIAADVPAISKTLVPTMSRFKVKQWKTPENISFNTSIY